MPPVYFPILPSLNAVCPAILYLFIACSTLDYSSILPPFNMSLFFLLPLKYCQSPAIAHCLMVYDVI